MINNFFWAWGHRFLYDADTLRQALCAAGFNDIQFYKPGISAHPNLKNLEVHGRELKSEEINQFETVVIDACKQK